MKAFTNNPAEDLIFIYRILYSNILDKKKTPNFS